MKKEITAKAAMAAFLGACLIPSAGMLLLPPEPAAANQILSPPPRVTVDGRLNPAVLDEVSAYVSDHLALRQRLITANATLNAAVFRVSAADDVLLGKGDWLFYRETLPDVLRTEPLSERRLHGTARTLALASEYAAARGARLYFTIAPNKASLYPEYLPDAGEPMDGAADADRLVPYLEREGVSYIDLYAPFRAQPETLYFHTDSHWNARGAALACDAVLSAMGRDGGTFFGGPSQEGEPHKGDLYEMLYPAGTYREPDAAFPFTYEYTRRFRSPEDQRIETACAGQDGALLMFRDSFGNSLHGYLAQSFGTALFSRPNPYRLDLLEETGADTVLIEIVERNLEWLSERPPVFPAPVRVPDGDAPVGEAEFTIKAADGETCPGYVRMEGRLRGPVDTDSPIYIGLGGTWYEAAPAGDWDGFQDGWIPFALYVERSAADEGAALRYRSGGAAYEARQVRRHTEGAD